MGYLDRRSRPKRPCPARALVSSGTPEIDVTVPDNTSFLVINGTVGPDCGPMTVSWEGLKPALMIENLMDTWFEAPSNASRPYVPTGELLYYAVLDPTAGTYVLRLSPNEPKDRIALHSVTFYSALSA